MYNYSFPTDNALNVKPLREAVGYTNALILLHLRLNTHKSFIIIQISTGSFPFSCSSSSSISMFFFFSSRHADPPEGGSASRASRANFFTSACSPSKGPLLSSLSAFRAPDLRPFSSTRSPPWASPPFKLLHLHQHVLLPVCFKLKSKSIILFWRKI